MAGRRQKNTVDYFPHYVSSGKTLFVLESKFGHLGYSVWFKTLELLGKSPNHFLDIRDETELLFLISRFRVTKQEIEDVYDLLAKLGAIDADMWRSKVVFSENFIENIADAYKRRSNECLHKADLCKQLGIKTNKVHAKKAQKKHISSNKLEDFKSEAIKYIGDYDAKIVNEFIDYWTEPNQKGKMKFEFQQTFDIKRRLAAWKKRGDSFSGKSSEKPMYKMKFGA